MSTEAKTGQKISKKAANPKKTTKKRGTKKSAPAKKKKTKFPKTKVLTGKAHQADLASKPIVWNDRRQAVVKAMRKLGAISASTARPAEDIAKKANFKGLDVVKVKLHCDVYRGSELIKQGFANSTREEGSRSLLYYLTAKGKSVKF